MTSEVKEAKSAKTSGAGFGWGLSQTRNENEGEEKSPFEHDTPMLARTDEKWAGLKFLRWSPRSGGTRVFASLAAVEPFFQAPPSYIQHERLAWNRRARYRRLVRLLHQLRTPEIEPPVGVIGEVLAVLEQAATRRVVRSLLTGRRAAYAGALVGAGGATAGLVILARPHSRLTEMEGTAGA